MSPLNTQTDSQESDVTKEKKNTHSFPVSIAIDPIRILAGILTRWYWLVLGALLFGVVGTLVGIKIDKQTFSLSTALIKRKVPQTLRTSEIGQAFRPVDFNDATLLSTLLATEPLDWAGKRIDNGLSGIEVARKVEATQLENTDIYYITYHSPISAQDAVKFMQIWSEEILEYTQRLQQSEARIVRDIIGKEVRQLEFRIDQLGQRIIDFAERNNFVGGEAQVAAILGKVNQIDFQLQDAQAKQTSLLQQVKEYRNKIKHHSPLEMRLRNAEQELANLRSTYTDQNPLVMSKLESIRYLKNEVEGIIDTQDDALEQFTGTDLGNTLYLNIISTNNQLTDVENKISSLRAQRTVEIERLKKYPTIIAKYNALETKRGSLLSELSLLSKRLKETEIFASGSPGYFQIFEEPDFRKVSPSSLVLRPLILGLLGMLIGAGIALMIMSLKTQRSSMRSSLECCATTGAPLLGLFSDSDLNAAAYDDFWLKHVAAKSKDQSPILILTAALTAEDENLFWRGLSEAVSRDYDKKLKVYDLNTGSSCVTAQDTISCVDWNDSGDECFIWRVHSLPSKSQRGMLKSVKECYALIKNDKTSTKAYGDVRKLFEIYLPPCQGTIIISAAACGRLRILADRMSLFLTQNLSKT